MPFVRIPQATTPALALTATEATLTMAAPISMNVKLATLAAPEASARTRTAVTHALARPVSPVTPKWHALTSTSAHRRHPASRRLPFAEEAPSATICPDLLNASARLDSRATLKLPVKTLTSA